MEEKIHIKEIATLIIESTSVALTSALIADLTEAGVNIIFCNRRHLPSAVFSPVHTHFSVSKNIKEQIQWDNMLKLLCHKYIIEEKIRQQALFLEKLGYNCEYEKLMEYQSTVLVGDVKNCEAKAAALYFRTLFGKNFNRDLPLNENNMLNYGYTLLMATFVREITACGYLTELGLWHCGYENAYNLACDLMEPFRVAVDKLTLAIPDEQIENYKHYMLRLFSLRIKINDERQELVPAIRIYLHRIFRFMHGDIDSIFNIEIMDETE
jgi:CRISPR-associated endonuclease Cas1 subtype II